MGLTPTARQRAPWQHVMDKNNLAWIDKLAKGVRLPSVWPRLRHLFAMNHRTSSTELLLFASPLGVYYLQFLRIDQAYKVEFIMQSD